MIDFTARMWPDEQRLQAEDILTRQAQLLAKVRESVIVTDLAGLITYWNAGATRVFGLTSEEMLGSPFADRYAGKLRGSVNEIIRAAAGGSDWSAEWEDYHKDGMRIWIDVRISRITDRANTPVAVLILAHDITERRHADGQARRLQNELAHFARISTMGEMATGIAHELNQPLSAIASFAHAAQAALKSHPCSDCQRLSTILEKIENQSLRASEIVKCLRRLVRKAAPQRSMVDLKDLIEDVLAMVQVDACLAEIEFSLELDPALPQLLADGVQIHQVILNLIRNAMDAVSGVEPSRRRIIIASGGRNPGEVEISVGDSGPGIPNEAAERVFEAFYTTKADGLGIGLAISRSIIESHNGRLWVESVVGEGATFHFTLPLAEGRAQPHG